MKQKKPDKIKTEDPTLLDLIMCSKKQATPTSTDRGQESVGTRGATDGRQAEGASQVLEVLPKVVCVLVRRVFV